MHISHHRLCIRLGFAGEFIKRHGSSRRRSPGCRADAVRPRRDCRGAATFGQAAFEIPSLLGAASRRGANNGQEPDPALGDEPVSTVRTRTAVARGEGALPASWIEEAAVESRARSGRFSSGGPPIWLSTGRGGDRSSSQVPAGIDEWDMQSLPLSAAIDLAQGCRRGASLKALP